MKTILITYSSICLAVIVASALGCPHSVLVDCANYRMELNQCLKDNGCSSFVNNYHTSIDSLPGLKTSDMDDTVGIYRSTAGEMIHHRLQAGPGYQLKILSDSFRPYDFDFSVSLLKAYDGRCSKEYYSSLNELVSLRSCFNQTNSICECNGRLSINSKSSLYAISFGFSENVALTDLVFPDVSTEVLALRPNRILEAVESANDAEEMNKVGDVPGKFSSTDHVLQRHQKSVGSVKASGIVHSIFVLIAFAGNAAFLVFVFWLAKV